MHATITNIQGYSIHDGPGIRTVVFIKGCDLNCRWCANPECILPAARIGYIDNLCTNCRTCFSVCPKGALFHDGYRINLEKCDACGLCVDACPGKALVKYGREMSAEEVFNAVRRDKLFYDPVGGVTASGGEPLLQADFVTELFSLCKGDGIGTCLETAGFAGTDSFLQVLPVTDHILFDLKHMDPEVHRKHTGQSNDLILQNARHAAQSGADLLFRIPLIPDVNDTAENIALTAEFIKSVMEKPKVELMPYHRLGDSKYKALNMSNPMHGLPAAEAGRTESVRLEYLRLGVECSISR